VSVRVGCDQAAVAERGALAREQHRGAPQPRGEVAGESQGKGQRPGGGTRASCDVEALLDSERAVRIPLCQRSVRVADTVGARAWHSGPNWPKRAPMAVGGECHAKLRGARGNHDAAAREASVKMLFRGGSPQALDAISRRVLPERCRDRALRGQRQAFQAMTS
jgi:hypothetical protein